MNYSKLLIAVSLLWSGVTLCAQNTVKGYVYEEGTQKAIPNVLLFAPDLGWQKETDSDGYFEIELENSDTLYLTFFKENYANKPISIDPKVAIDTLEVYLAPLNLQLSSFELNAYGSNSAFNLRKLSNVEGMGIYAGKKTEVIDLTRFVGNKVSNNAREVFAAVPGLNIWENDASGLQLNIGARGLDPNRTAHFNTRQNGYDISADALGYPESYYIPPIQALERIEIIRGAASLQYGPQFGGLLNFVFRDFGDEKFVFETENSVGSYGLFSTFNTIGGKIKKWKYHAFYQYKRGDGWRPNSGFYQHMFFGKVEYLGTKFQFTAEHTAMDYLAQQAGGLMDFEFEDDPYKSKRSRNWFAVDWNLTSLTMAYKLGERSKLESRSFLLSAFRQSVGELGPINRPDPMMARDLIVGNYNNFGTELRYLFQYSNRYKELNSLLVGGRIYRGNTENQQGLGSSNSDADFNFTNEEPYFSQYIFPGTNLAFFAEHLFNFSKGWSVSPGIRLESITTRADGYYYNRVFAGSILLLEEKINVDTENPRFFPLLGLGVSKKWTDKLESYGNFSQNFRSINFSDISITNPNLIVDQELKDETGYNLDMGIRGGILNEILRFDLSAFYLSYQDRIGTTEIEGENSQLVSYRTNVGDARIIGIEAFSIVDVSKWAKWSNVEVQILNSFSFQNGVYTNSTRTINGNKVELIPPFSWKIGVGLVKDNLSLKALFNYTHEHYTDATNAVRVSNATRGIIPSYAVLDLSAVYTLKSFTFSAGLNNALNSSYFTRRANSYPGPGIIPATPLNFYFSTKFNFSVKP